MTHEKIHENASEIPANTDPPPCLHDHRHAGTATLIFLCEFTSLPQFPYRLSTGSGEVFEDVTAQGGSTGTLVLDSGEDFIPLGLTEPVWRLHKAVASIPVQIEVRRNDGTWKTIGNFQLEAGKNKEITAQIDTIKIPFKLGLVKGA